MSRELKIVENLKRMAATRYDTPRLVFRTVEDTPLTLEYGMAYYPGCFRPTGVTDSHTAPMVKWCDYYTCGVVSTDWNNHITFDNEQQLVMFLLRWNNA